ncbi:MAG: D-glycero-beta-D-manno-heptose 1,7-bisphosphate 7-phosphatase [Candidatus Accumulibacter sp.]|jgi:D-glycero-D-manno-heptose 1,7-bisphosphate phosphatase|nr:D-glycero-beta-D-manno-heptose 1,7-bisphosphate 7-phosphatase [Accumulibacter sp.]
MKLIILDRDGVINKDSDGFIKSPDEWEAIPGSLESIARLTRAGHRVVLATNQSGIGRGLFDMDSLNAIHDKMRRSLDAHGGRIDAVFYCPHTAEADCACRKPKPGMFLSIAERFEVELAREIIAVGDSLRDLEAAAAAGVTPALVLTGKGAKTRAECGLPEGTLVFDDLAAAVEHILGA